MASHLLKSQPMQCSWSSPLDTGLHLHNRQHYTKLGWLTDRNISTCMDFPNAKQEIILQFEIKRIRSNFDIIMEATQSNCSPPTALVMAGYENGSISPSICKSYASVFGSRGLWSCKFRCHCSHNSICVPYIHFLGTPIDVCEIYIK